ncbi:MAG: serine hydrolase [Pyrinomonadaceae bacterium]|nr:serine hydrolase [Pyrinomonadaceae bacterium]
MKKYTRVLSVILLLLAVQLSMPAAVYTADRGEIVKSKNYSPLNLTQSPDLKKLLDVVVSDLLKKYPDGSFKANEIAVTLIDLTDPTSATIADYRGEEKIYPASVVKMFYMAALEQQLADGKIRLTPELERGVRDMIVDSSNEATQYIVDVLTETSSGSELPKKEFEKWSFRRNRMNRYFSSMGYTNINVNQKTHCEDAYGVEQQFRNYKGENRNMLTTNASARLIAEIALGRLLNAERTKRMMDLLKREPLADPGKGSGQAVNYSGKALIDKNLREAKLWSKAGWTSRAKHDAAYIELPDGRKFAIAVFTENHANDKDALPSVVAGIIDSLRK